MSFAFSSFMDGIGMKRQMESNKWMKRWDWRANGRVGWLICGGLWAARGHNAPQRERPAQPNSSFLSIYWRNWNKLRKKWEAKWEWRQMKLNFFSFVWWNVFGPTAGEESKLNLSFPFLLRGGGAEEERGNEMDELRKQGVAGGCRQP